MEPKLRWEEVYRSKAPEEVSWYQPHLTCSLELIREVASGREAVIVDVGGGASTLVDDLLAEGFAALSVLDLSGAAESGARKTWPGGARRQVA